MRAHYPGGATRGSSIYRPALDLDGDGVACEPASTVPIGDYLRIRSIGTFTGTGNSAETIIRLDTGVYRIVTTRIGDWRGWIDVDMLGISTTDRESVSLFFGDRSVAIMHVGNEIFQNGPGTYLLDVEAEGSWQIQIVKIGTN